MSATATLSLSIPTVTDAKPKLGSLIDRALDGEMVFIRRGQELIQLVRAIQPPPVPVFPPGSIVFDDERVADIKALPIIDTFPKDL